MARCLVIDDSETMRSVARRLLEAEGHVVSEAPGAGEGVQIVSEAACDVVLLDWDLPRMGALDFLRAAAEFEVKPVIVLCATENDPRQFALAKTVGAPFHLLKPFDVQTMTEIMIRVGHAPSIKAVA